MSHSSFQSSNYCPLHFAHATESGLNALNSCAPSVGEVCPRLSRRSVCVTRWDHSMPESSPPKHGVTLHSLERTVQAWSWVRRCPKELTARTEESCPDLIRQGTQWQPPGPQTGPKLPPVAPAAPAVPDHAPKGEELVVAGKTDGNQ
jgi:hypothetical protein